MIDPWGGSYYVERLTRELAEKAWGHIQEVEESGGMAKAIEAGIPKLRIEEAAARTQARIDSGRQTVVGVNKFLLGEKEDVPVLKVDNVQVRAQQIASSSSSAGARPEGSRGEADRADQGGRDRRGQPAGARHRGRPGEVHRRRDLLALEKVYGRHKAEIKAISGVYSGEVGEKSDVVKTVHKMVETFEVNDGRRPRILIAKMGQDGHDRGQKVIASAFADLGFDVDIGPLFQTPAEVARQAVENDVHVGRRQLARCRPPDAGAGAEGGAEEAGPRGHPDRRRRRHPAAGLRGAVRRGRGSHLSAGHGHQPGGDLAAQRAEQTPRLHQRSRLGSGIGIVTLTRARPAP